MSTLSPNWFFESLPDFEYKKYLLLAYLQHVQQHFNETKLYPDLGDLVFHYRNLQKFNDQKNAFIDSVPENISEIDLQNLRLCFSKVISNDDLMKYLDEILGFSLPAIKKHLDEGKNIYDFIEKEISITPVGILPLYRNEGYVLVKDGDVKEIRVYEYQVKLFSYDDEQFRSVNMEYLTSYKRSIVHTSENIKIEMVRNRKKFPNPATYCVETPYEFPLEETLIPLTKRILLKYVES
jgi:hypothetical protein